MDELLRAGPHLRANGTGPLGCLLRPLGLSDDMASLAKDSSSSKVEGTSSDSGGLILMRQNDASLGMH